MTLHAKALCLMRFLWALPPKFYPLQCLILFKTSKASQLRFGYPCLLSTVPGISEVICNMLKAQDQRADLSGRSHVGQLPTCPDRGRPSGDNQRGSFVTYLYGMQETLRAGTWSSLRPMGQCKCTVERDPTDLFDRPTLSPRNSYHQLTAKRQTPAHLQ